MKTEELLEVLKNIKAEDKDFLDKAKEAERYYKGDNDILDVDVMPKKHLQKTGNTEIKSKRNPLRHADNRIASNFYGFLVDQKASYLLGKPPDFDVGDDTKNEEVDAILGSHFDKTCKHVCIDASNCTIGWIHSWIDAEGFYHYSAVDPKQVKPIWGSTLEHKLLGVLRTYTTIDEEDLKTYDYLDFFDNEYIHRFRKPSESEDKYYEPVLDFTQYDLNTESYVESNDLKHGFSKVPFSAFFNNHFGLNDLKKIKGYIDVYDMAFSCFGDDLEDASEMILVFTNQPGTPAAELRRQIEQEGACHVVSNQYTKTGIDTLAIEVPVTARQTLLDLCRKNIFEQGQGVDPTPESYGNTSGEALKYMYANLELKATAARDEFKIGFEHFIGLICEYLGFTPEKIEQVWTTTKIENTTELIDQLVKSESLLSQETILRHHPFVDDVEAEKERLAEDEEKKQASFDAYRNAFKNMNEPQEEEQDEV